MTAATDHEQIRAGRDVEQHPRRMSADDQAPHPLAISRSDFLADYRFDRLFGVFFEAAVLDRKSVV